jgi:hypothetical protein
LYVLDLRFLENGGDPHKTVTAEMVAHQYDHMGRSTRAGSSHDSQTNHNTPQTLPKKTRYNLRSVDKSTKPTTCNTSMNEELRSEHVDVHMMDRYVDQIDVDQMDLDHPSY